MNDLALGVLYKMCRSIMSGHGVRNASASATSARLANRAIYDRLFDCPMQFGADFDGIVIDVQTWNAAIRAPIGARVSRAGARWRVIDARPIARSTEEVEQSIRLLMPMRTRVDRRSRALARHERPHAAAPAGTGRRESSATSSTASECSR